jgi:hypothetical protein
MYGVRTVFDISAPVGVFNLSYVIAVACVPAVDCVSAFLLLFMLLPLAFLHLLMFSLMLAFQLLLQPLVSLAFSAVAFVHDVAGFLPVVGVPAIDCILAVASFSWVLAA